MKDNVLSISPCAAQDETNSHLQLIEQNRKDTNVSTSRIKKLTLAGNELSGARKLENTIEEAMKLQMNEYTINPSFKRPKSDAESGESIKSNKTSGEILTTLKIAVALNKYSELELTLE